MTWAGYRRDPDPGAPDDAANIIVQILQVIFDLLVRLIDLIVDLLKSLG